MQRLGGVERGQRLAEAKLCIRSPSTRRSKQPAQMKHGAGQHCDSNWGLMLVRHSQQWRAAAQRGLCPGEVAAGEPRLRGLREELKTRTRCVAGLTAFGGIGDVPGCQFQRLRGGRWVSALLRNRRLHPIQRDDPGAPDLVASGSERRLRLGLLQRFVGSFGIAAGEVQAGEAHHRGTKPPAVADVACSGHLLLTQRNGAPNGIDSVSEVAVSHRGLGKAHQQVGEFVGYSRVCGAGF